MKPHALVLLLAALVSCSEAGETSSSRPTPTSQAEDSPLERPTAQGDSELCELVELIRSLDETSKAFIEDMLSDVEQAPSEKAARRAFEEGMAEWKELADEALPQVVETYEQLEQLVPDSLAEDVSTISSFSVDLMGVMSDMESLNDFQNLGTEIQGLGAVEAGQAVLRLDEYTTAECDISIAS